jgi:hypothetical protein
VDARLVVDVRNRANELREDALDFGGLESAVRQEVVVEFIACRVSAAGARSVGGHAPYLGSTRAPARPAAPSL